MDNNSYCRDPHREHPNPEVDWLKFFLEASFAGLALFWIGSQL